MLMDILMEALMAMDDETLNGVLESCNAEELEIINDAMEARFEDGPTVVADKKSMKTDYINRREESKKTTPPSSYNLDEKLVKKYRGRSAAQQIGHYSRDLNKSNDPFLASLDPQFAAIVSHENSRAKEKYKRDIVNTTKSLNKINEGHTHRTIGDARSIIDGNRSVAKLRYPNNKAKQAECLRKEIKKDINDSAKYYR